MSKSFVLFLNLCVVFSLTANRPYSDDVYKKVVEYLKRQESYYASLESTFTYNNYCSADYQKECKEKASFYKEAQEAIDPIKFLYDYKKNYKKYTNSTDRNYLGSAAWSDLLSQSKELNSIAWLHYEQNPLMQKLKDKIKQHSIVSHSLLHLKAASTAKPTEIKKSISDALEKALEKEEQLIQQGYVVFYHGQYNKWGFLQDFTRLLINELYAKKVVKTNLSTDFMFIQNFSDLEKMINKNFSSKILKQEAQKRLAMIKAGKQLYDGKEAYHLYTNMFLFGNSDNSGNCTWSYMQRNTNCNTSEYVDLTGEISTVTNNKDLFTDSYKKRLQDLITRYRQCFRAGRLIQIAIPEKKVDDYVYFGHGRKSMTKTGEEVTKVSQVLQHFKAGDESVLKWYYRDAYWSSTGELEYVIPLTKDFVLNPNSGVKIFAYNSKIKDQQAHDQVIKDMQKLAADIASDIAKYENGSFLKKLPYKSKKAIYQLKYQAKNMVQRSEYWVSSIM